MWRQVLQALDFYLSRSKMVYMKSKFNRRHTNPNFKVKIGDYSWQEVTWYKYFESIIQKDEEIEP